MPGVSLEWRTLTSLQELHRKERQQAKEKTKVRLAAGDGKLRGGRKMIEVGQAGAEMTGHTEGGVEVPRIHHEVVLSRARGQG